MRTALTGVRARAAGAALLVVAAALLVSSALLLTLLQRGLTANVDDAATTRTLEVGAQLRQDGPRGLQPDLEATTHESQLVQVLDPAGAVIASSTPRAGQVPLSNLRPRAGQVLRGQVSGLQLFDQERPYLVVARGTPYRGSTYTVVVATSVQAEQDALHTVAAALLVGVPLLVLLVGAATWVLVGRALRPVERIRSRVAGISAARLDERVPVPPTGDEVARLALTMNAMLDRLQGSQATQHRLVADAGNELRSPLTTLVATMEIAQADPTGGTWRELAPVLEAETARMRRLVEDLLLLARADEDGLRIELSDVDLDDLLGEEARRLRLAGGPRVELDVQHVRVTGDAGALGQVLRNLADNASRAASSVVRLSLHAEPAEAVLRVQDDGAGIAEADRGRVFERFVRLDHSRDRGSGGSGLGLAIVREIVRCHDGTVSVTRSPLGGACFEVRLPAGR